MALVGTLAVGSAKAQAQAKGNPHDYQRVDLVSDRPGAAIQDGSLVNAWGLSAGPTTPLWVADNGTDVSTLYAGFVNGSPIQKIGLTVAIPGGAPTGTVFNPTSGFEVHNGADHGPSLFLFASESGDITGWSPAVPPPFPSQSAQPAVHKPGAIYKGLALADTGNGTLLYGANFHAGTIDAWDSDFHPVHPSGGFRDGQIPKGFAPFNIQALNGRLYVTYAKQDADAEDDVAGRGNGFVDVFDTNGNLLGRLNNTNKLNSPWGLAIAPASFGKFGGDLLVGNFGDGRIHAYDLASGHYRGELRGEHNRPMQIDGLWGLRFGNGTIGTPDTLMFSAGPNDEAHGLLGAITASGRH